MQPMDPRIAAQRPTGCCSARLLGCGTRSPLYLIGDAASRRGLSRVGYFITLNGPLNGHTPSYFYKGIFMTASVCLYGQIKIVFQPEQRFCVLLVWLLCSHIHSVTVKVTDTVTVSVSVIDCVWLTLQSPTESDTVTVTLTVTVTHCTHTHTVSDSHNCQLTKLTKYWSTN